MSDMYVYMYVCMHVCTKSFLKPQQIPRVFAHTWRIKLILILILNSQSFFIYLHTNMSITPKQNEIFSPNLTHIQVHLNKLECRGKVHLFQ